GDFGQDPCACTEDSNCDGICAPAEDRNGDGDCTDPLFRSPTTGAVFLTVEPAPIVTPGTLVTLNASRTSLACADSSIQFRFSRADGFNVSFDPPTVISVIQDWSGDPTAEDVALTDLTYKVEVRCAPTADPVVDPVLLQQQSAPVASDAVEVEVVDIFSRPTRPSTSSGSGTVSFFFASSGLPLSQGIHAVNRYEVRRTPMVEGPDGRSLGFPGRALGAGDYTDFGTDGLAGAPGTIGGLKYKRDGSSVAMAAGPICDETSVAGDDLYFDNAPGLDELELPCFEDDTIPCFTDNAEPVDLAPFGDPPGYFHVVTAALGTSVSPLNTPIFTTRGSHSSRPVHLDAPTACP
ncbi:MAG: hypothetical protein HY509_00960, partial [Acidobacteria bacterium]|nr:hypothetical protein [Acidobacteriota bacterium]